MPRKAKELSAIEVKRLTNPGYHFVGEVPGLALQVLPTGGRSWVLRTMVGTRRRDMGLGSYPEVSLADARTKARDARNSIREGIDPIAVSQAARSALKAATATVMTFDQAAAKYITAHRAGWRNPKHILQWEATLSTYASPIIGALSVADIRLPHILAVLEQPIEGETLWKSRTETASRLRGRMEVILDWCKGRGYRSGDNPAAWKGNLDAQLPKPGKLKGDNHHAALSLDDMGAFMAELRQREGTAARALEFTILCASRSSEVFGMKWSEVDRAAGVWTIPGTRMKAGREHRVPLSKAALKVLDGLPVFEDNKDGTVFVAPRGGMLSNMAMTQIMRRMGREEVPHGFRSTFRDWASERTSYPSEMAEMALAHTISNKVEAAYRRGDMMEKRRSMMTAWAEFCYTVTPKGVVIGIREKA